MVNHVFRPQNGSRRLNSQRRVLPSLTFKFHFLHRFRQGVLLVRRMEIEINAAHGAFLVALAEDDCDKFVQRDAMAHAGGPVFISRDRLFHERLQ